MVGLYRDGSRRSGYEPIPTGKAVRPGIGQQKGDPTPPPFYAYSLNTPPPSRVLLLGPASLSPSRQNSGSTSTQNFGVKATCGRGGEAGGGVGERERHSRAPGVFRVWGLRFRVQGLGFKIQGLAFRVEGLGFRI